MLPLAEMEITGFNLDEGRWREQLEKVKVAQAKAADELQDMLSAGVAQASLFGRAEINLDSQQQVTDALLNLGVPVPNTTRAWELQPLAEKYPVVGKLLEYRGVAKSLSSFGENILEYIEPQTGRIHADFRQIGAPTGRFSCSNPNLQQIPHDEQYRRCFTAPPGRKLVIADYSQIELRILGGLFRRRELHQSVRIGRGLSQDDRRAGLQHAARERHAGAAFVREAAEFRRGLRHRRFAVRDDDGTFADRCREHDASIFRRRTAGSIRICGNQGGR